MELMYSEGATRIANLICQKAEELKNKNEAVLIFPHRSVDGDCIGSSCALAGYFRKLGANAWVCMPEKLPDDMTFLGVEDLLFYPEEDFAKGDLMVNGFKYSTAFSVDCTEGHRMGSNQEIFEVYEEALDVDHHEVTHLGTPLKWIEPQASSACEMVFYVGQMIASVKSVELGEVIDKRIACCLMAGIVTDTGRFTYSNTRPETLDCAGKLMTLGGDISEVCYMLFDRKTSAAMKITSAALSEAEFMCDGKLAISIITTDMFTKYGAGTDDVAEVVSRLRDVAGVAFACVLRETGDGAIRANLRSKGEFNCCEFAARFDGGGHKNASGFTVKNEDIHDLASRIVREASAIL